MTAKRSRRKRVNLALQGGGAHGAFTWGVLDAFLEDGRIEIEAVSGTSAGAINAVVATDGFMRDGVPGARARLRHFWERVSKTAQLSPIRRTPHDVVTGNWNLDHSPGYLMYDFISRLASPYELNPLNINPLRELIGEIVDFDRVRACEQLKIYVSATNVKTGRAKVFEREDLTLDALMASCCLPDLFQAIEVGGEYYWDGGYMGNPVLYPFLRHCTSRDVIVVQINPIVRDSVPTTAREILNRVNEITFNASLLREFLAIDFVTRMLDEGKLDDSFCRVFLHCVEAGDQLSRLGASSKLNAEWPFFDHLYRIGRDTAHAWIEEHYDRLGRESSFDVRAFFNS